MKLITCIIYACSMRCLKAALLVLLLPMMLHVVEMLEVMNEWMEKD